MLKNKFERALRDGRVFLVPAGYSPKGVTRVRMYLINELGEIERVKIPIDGYWNSKKNDYNFILILQNYEHISPVYVLLLLISQKLGFDMANFEKLPPIL